MSEGCTWLKLLPLEIDEFGEVFEPQIEIDPKETVIGTVSESLKKLYSMSKSLEKQASILGVEVRFGTDNPELKGKCHELAGKAKALDLIFWIEVHDELKLWSHDDSLGLRKGWVIVEFKREDSPPFFKFLGGGYD